MQSAPVKTARLWHSHFGDSKVPRCKCLLFQIAEQKEENDDDVKQFRFEMICAKGSLYHLEIGGKDKGKGSEER